VRLVFLLREDDLSQKASGPGVCPQDSSCPTRAVRGKNLVESHPGLWRSSCLNPSLVAMLGFAVFSHDRRLVVPPRYTSCYCVRRRVSRRTLPKNVRDHGRFFCCCYPVRSAASSSCLIKPPFDLHNGRPWEAFVKTWQTCGSPLEEAFPSRTSQRPPREDFGRTGGKAFVHDLHGREWDLFVSGGPWDRPRVFFFTLFPPSRCSEHPGSLSGRGVLLWQLPEEGRAPTVMSSFL